MICRRQFIAECLGVAILRAGRRTTELQTTTLTDLAIVGGSLLPMDFREQARSHIGQILSGCRSWLACDGCDELRWAQAHHPIQMNDV